MNIKELVEWHEKNNRESTTYASDDSNCLVTIAGKRWAVAGFIEGANFTIDDLEDK